MRFWPEKPIGVVDIEAMEESLEEVATSFSAVVLWRLIDERLRMNRMTVGPTERIEEYLTSANATR